MEELLMLRQYIEQQRYAEALALIGEMEEMSREDKLNKIYSYAILLLLHLIKQNAENRTTRSWDYSIRNAAREILRINKRRKAGGTYATSEELKEILEEAYQSALERAALEAFEGQYSDEKLAGMIDKEAILAKALALIEAR
jgi:hypothetical protein